MKKFLLSALMFLTTLSASAQLISASRDNGGVKFGVRGSFALSNMNKLYESDLDEDETYKSLPAFGVGVAMDLPVLESFHFNVGLQYVLKGQKLIEDNEYELETEFTRIGYVEMPIQPQFRLNISNSSHVNINFGPYIALAVHGHEKETNHDKEDKKDFINKYYIFSGNGYTIDKDDKKKKFKYEDYREEDDSKSFKSDYSRFDVGLAMGVSYEIEQFHIGFTYDLGLKDINANAVDDKHDIEEAKKYGAEIKYEPLKNRSLLFTIGFNF